MINAQEARRIALANTKKKKEDILDDLNSKVVAAMSNGDLFVELNEYPYEVEEELEELGYKLERDDKPYSGTDRIYLKWG